MYSHCKISWSLLAHLIWLHFFKDTREKLDFESCNLNQILFAITLLPLIWPQTKFPLVLNQSEKCNYNSNLVWFITDFSVCMCSEIFNAWKETEILGVITADFFHQTSRSGVQPFERRVIMIIFVITIYSYYKNCLNKSHDIYGKVIRMACIFKNCTKIQVKFCLN